MGHRRPPTTSQKNVLDDVPGTQLPFDPGADDKSDEAQGYILKQEFTSVIFGEKKGMVFTKESEHV